MEWTPYWVTVGLIVVAVLALCWWYDWTLRRRIRDALRERGREVNAARLRLRELNGDAPDGVCGE